jgi:uncharacterized delta-60 repeat protein
MSLKLPSFIVQVLFSFSLFLLMSQFASAVVTIPSGSFDSQSSFGNGGGNGFSGGHPYSTVLQPDGNLVVSGSFTHWNGVPVSKTIRLTSNGALDTSFNFTDSAFQIYRMEIQSSGKTVAWGWDSDCGGCTAIKRLNTDGSIDSSYNSVAFLNGEWISAMSLMSNDKIVLSVLGGTDAQRLYRLNSDGTVDSTFNSGTAADPYINVIKELSDGGVLIGGSFTTYNGVSAIGLARINSDGSLNTSFSSGTGVTGVTVIKVQIDGKVLVAGSFSTYNGSSVGKLIRLNTNGTLDNSFANNGSWPYAIDSIEIQDDQKIVVVTNPKVKRLFSDGTVDSAYSQYFDNYYQGFNAKSILRSDNTLILTVGYFTQGVFSSNSFALIKSDGTLDLSFNPNPGSNDTIRAMVEQSNGNIIAVGDFTTYGTTSVGRIARVNSSGSFDPTFNSGSGFDDSVYAIALQTDGKLLVGGAFNTYNGGSYYYFVRLLADGIIDPSFTVNLSEVNGYVSKIYIQSDGKIILVSGGWKIVRLNSDGTLDSSFSIGTGPTDYRDVSDIAIQSDGKIIAAGNFSTYNGESHYTVVRLNSDGSIDNTFNTQYISMGGDTTLGIQSDGKIIVAGNIYAPGVSQGWIGAMRLNTDGSFDTSFTASDLSGSRVLSMKILPDDSMYIAGNFGFVNGVTEMLIAKLFSNGDLDTSFSSGTGTFEGDVKSVVYTANHSLVVAGWITTFNSQGTNNVFRLFGDTSYFYQISNLDGGTLDADTNLGSVKVGSNIGYSISNVSVTVKYNGMPVSEILVDFSGGSDRDWSAVNMGNDLSTGRAFVANLNPVDAPGAASTHSLYVPKLVGQTSVYICPTATALNEVYLGCAGGYTLSEGASNLTTATVNSQDYWVISGLTGTGALGLSQIGTPFTLTPNSDVMSGSQEVVMSYGITSGFASGDKVQFHFEPTAGFVLANTCATPTTDSNNDTVVDGSGAIVGSDVYEYTFSSTVGGPTTLSFCAVVTSPATAGSYSVSLTDDSGRFGSSMYYVGGDNEVFVIANVAPSLSFNIRTLADDADTNVCSFGTVSPSDTLPNYDNVDDGASECGYALAVGTNAANGFQVQITADNQLNGTSGNIADISNGGTFTSGVESYGLANVTGSTSGRNVTTGGYTESILRNGNFNLGANTGTNIPLSATNFVSYTNGIQYVAGVDSLDTTSVVHGLVIGSGTPAGYYDQVLTYTTTANF